MACTNQKKRLRLINGIGAFTILSLISQAQASIFGKSNHYNAVEVRGVSTPLEPALLRGLAPRGLTLGNSIAMEMSWRYAGGGSGPNAGIDLGLFRRQTGSNIEAYCDKGMHICRADQVGCCNNNAYCIINTEGKGECCPLGSVCGSDPCKATSTYCSQIITVTETPTGTDTAASAVVTTTTSTGCCIRACAMTMHLCDQKFGGLCCNNDAACIPSNMCQPTPDGNLPTSVTTRVIVTTTSDLCSTGSFACAQAAGGGCCPNAMICTEVSSTAGCAPTGSGVTTKPVTRKIFTDNSVPTAGGMITDAPSFTPSATGTGDAANASNTDSIVSATPSSDPGLSSGAKAGIGIGAAAGVLALGAIGAFFFVRHRKDKQSAAAAAQPPPPPNQPMDPQMMQYGGYAGQQHGGGYADQQSPYYQAGTVYPQNYHPAPQGSPLMAPVHQGYYDPGEAAKQQHGQGYAGGQQEPVLLPNTVHHGAVSELAAPGTVHQAAAVSELSAPEEPRK